MTHHNISPAIDEDSVTDWCSWKDVEECINNPQFYELEFIDNGGKLICPICLKLVNTTTT